MKLKVRAYATLRRYLPDVPLGQSTMLEVPPGTTVGAALDRLGIPRTETRICFVNGRQSELDQGLEDADELVVFPPVGGGR